jgi:hypothetical protein
MTKTKLPYPRVPDRPCALSYHSGPGGLPQPEKPCAHVRCECVCACVCVSWRRAQLRISRAGDVPARRRIAASCRAVGLPALFSVAIRIFDTSAVPQQRARKLPCPPREMTSRQIEPIVQEPPFPRPNDPDVRRHRWPEMGGRRISVGPGESTKCRAKTKKRCSALQCNLSFGMGQGAGSEVSLPRGKCIKESSHYDTVQIILNFKVLLIDQYIECVQIRCGKRARRQLKKNECPP